MARCTQSPAALPVIDFGSEYSATCAAIIALSARECQAIRPATQSPSHSDMARRKLVLVLPDQTHGLHGGEFEARLCELDHKQAEQRDYCREQGDWLKYVFINVRGHRYLSLYRKPKV